ncbi:NUDIX hydrolase [Fictibacillus macauensis]
MFPGGGIENGETPEAGAKREAFKELGVLVR